MNSSQSGVRTHESIDPVTIARSGDQKPMSSFASVTRSTRRTAIKALLGAPIVISALTHRSASAAENVAAADPKSLGTLTFAVAGLDYRNQWEHRRADGCARKPD